MVFVFTFSFFFGLTLAIMGYNAAFEFLLDWVYYEYGRDAYKSCRYWWNVFNWCLCIAALFEFVWVVVRLDGGEQVPYVEKLKRLIK